MSNILGLDIGERKIGVARANTIARIAEPLTTLPNNESFPAALSGLIADHQASTLIVGLPRGLDGQETAQTQYVRDFVDQLKVTVPVVFQDEAVTSIAARDILDSKGRAYSKEDVDAVAASIIVADYLEQAVHHA